MEPWHRSITENLEFLEGKRTEQSSFDRYQDGFIDRVTGLEPFSLDKETQLCCTAGDIRFSGRFIGGCMDVLEWYHRKGNIMIDRFLNKYADDGFIWYMETYDMDESRMSNMFKGMIEDGWFRNVKGFVFGRPLFYKGGDYRKTIVESLNGLDVPIVFDADVGHKPPRMVFVNGAMADITKNEGQLRICYHLD